MNKHTKIPWEIKWQHQTGVMIGRVGDATLVADALNTSIDHAEAQANAELILQACNGYEELLGLLKVAKCPACDGSGGIPHQFGEADWELEQCRWCYERDAAVEEVEE